MVEHNPVEKCLFKFSNENINTVSVRVTLISLIYMYSGNFCYIKEIKFIELVLVKGKKSLTQRKIMYLYLLWTTYSRFYQLAASFHLGFELGNFLNKNEANLSHSKLLISVSLNVSVLCFAMYFTKNCKMFISK